MNWLILIIAGLCETAFAFCLGKTKLVDGTEYGKQVDFVDFTALEQITSKL